MFVTASVELKFHNWPHESSDELIYEHQGCGNINSLSLSGDNSFLTFVPDKGNPEIVSLKDLGNIKNVHTISAVPKVSTIAFQRTTKRGIGLGTNNGQIVLYDTRNKLISRLFQSAPCAVNLLDFSGTDEHMAVSCENGSVLLYDVQQGKVCEIYSTDSSSFPATAMRYHPIDKHILTIGTADGKIIEWDTSVDSTRFCAQIHTAPITSFVMLHKSDILVSVGYDHKFCIHDLLNGEYIFKSNHQYPLTAVDVSNDGLTVAVGSAGGVLNIYDMRKLVQPLISWQAHDSKINKILFQHHCKRETDDSSQNCITTQEIIVKHENHCTESNEIDVKTLHGEKGPLESDLKCASEKSTGDKRCPNEAVNLKSIKHEVAESIHRGANELRNHIMAQFGSLHKFIANEFQTIGREMDEKWDLVQMTKNIQKKTKEKECFDIKE